MNGIGDSVRWRRRILGLGQAELAKRVHINRRPVTQSYISRIESGQIDVRLSVVRSLARALKIKPWQLLTNLSENSDFWRDYLELAPQQKRDIQRLMRVMLERR